MLTLFLLSNLLLLNVIEINCHGILMDPIARSSAWRNSPSLFPTYYNDMEMSCGGKPTQWEKNGGKCGICGEDVAKVQRFVKGGDLYRGHIVKTYKSADKIDVTLDIWTNHRGWYEFRLCNLDDPNQKENTECFKTLLADASGKTRFVAPDHISLEGKGTAKVSLQLPKGYKCDHCLFQWKWNVGNSHGIDFTTGQWCLGCGPQEQFYGCSDIRITDSGSQTVVAATTAKPVVVATTAKPVVVATTAKPVVVATTKAPTVNNNVAPLYGQCGGQLWTGPTVCVAGTTCKVQNQWYSQCL